MSGDVEPTVLKWEEYRRSITWQEPKEKWGFHRGHYPEFVLNGPDGSVGARGQLVLVPVGQGSPSLSSPFESVVVAVDGETEFYIGSDIYVLKQYDVLTLNSNIHYTYKNVGFTDALFFSYSTTTAKVKDAVPGPAAGATHLPWKEYRRQFHWGLPWADTQGSHRASGPQFGSTLGGHLVKHPVGQSNPWHGGGGGNDIGVLLLRGESEFTMGGRIWPLKPLDILRIPNTMPFIYTNVGLTEVLHLSFGPPRLPVRPGELSTRSDGSTYFESDPGWPVRPDAKRLDMSKWPSRSTTVTLPHSRAK